MPTSLMSLLVVLSFLLAHCFGLTTESPWNHSRCPMEGCKCFWDNPKISSDAQRNSIVCSKLSLRNDNLPPVMESNRTFHKIDLSFNSFDVLPDHYLSNLKGVEFVDLSGNSLTSLPVTVTANNGLKWLRMSHNNIDVILPNTFQRQKSLLMLNLTLNKLTMLEDHSFTGLDRLENLFLDENKISQISKNTFSEMTRLQKIDLTKNLISTIPPETFQGLSSLHYLDLDSNKLQDIPDNLFSDARALKDLKLDQNEIKTLHPDSFAGLFKLTSLSLDKNHIDHLPNGLFKDLFTMRYLTMTSNHFENISRGTFDNEKAGSNLRYLMIGSTHVKDLEQDFFAQFPRLSFLDLYLCPLKALPILRYCPGLKTLIISATEIRTLYPCDLVGLNQLTRIYWSVTAISCDCNVRWLRSWFDHHIDQVWYSKQSGGPWKCQSPATLKDTPFQLIPEEKFVCQGHQEPITCPYQYNPITQHFDRQRNSFNYTIEVSALYDGHTLQVQWNKDTLYVAEDKIKRFQVLLLSDVEYMAKSFPVAKHEDSFQLENAFSPNATHMNVCVEVIGIYNEIITFGCFELFSEKDRKSGEGRIIAPIIIVPLIAVIIAGIVFVVCFVRRYRNMGQLTGRSTNSGGTGIGNVLYDRFAEEGAEADPAVHTSQITISGLPSELEPHEMSA